MSNIPLVVPVSPSIPWVAGRAIAAGQFVLRDPATRTYHPWFPSGGDMPCGIAMAAAQAGQAVQVMAEGFFTVPVGAGWEPLVATPPVSFPAAPPGSICERCFDAPAFMLSPAPWGGEMGVCFVCAALPGEGS